MNEEYCAGHEEGYSEGWNAAMEQPTRPWVPLTEEDKDGFLMPFGFYWVINEIEEKLKEKNGF